MWDKKKTKPELIGPENILVVARGGGSRACGVRE